MTLFPVSLDDFESKDVLDIGCWTGGTALLLASLKATVSAIEEVKKYANMTSFLAKAFGIESPKSHGVTGTDVNALMAAGRYRDIAEYCLRDVKATVLLYQIWRERLAGVK